MLSKRPYLTFDDVQILPRYSEIESRSTVDTKTKFTRNYELDIPLVAAPMDTVCEYHTAIALSSMGGVGVIHRFMPIDAQSQMVAQVRADSHNGIVAAAIGANGDSKERAYALLQHGANVLVIDVAHGHHKNVKDIIAILKEYRQEFTFDIVAGNIATPEAALDLVDWGADALRVGVGGGSVCETRIRTGIGVPQFETIWNVCVVEGVPVISDGGIRFPGDAAKALAAGASTVMIGSLFAGTDEAPGEIFVAGQWPNTKKMKIYRGLASATTKLKHRGAAGHVEGASKMVESRGSITQIISDIMDGIKSSMSYVGASNLASFRQNAEFIRITPAGLTEAHPHLLL